MKMQLSKRGDYVVRSAIYLAWHHESPQPQKLREISSAMGIPRTFVPQILGDLVQAGLATSFFGTHGGYRLTRSPAEISLLEVIEAGEGAIETTQCVMGRGPCSLESACAMHESWTGALSALRVEFASTSLATVAERDRAIAAGPAAGALTGQRVETVEVADTVQVETSSNHVVDWLQTVGARIVAHLEAAQGDGDEALAQVRPDGPLAAPTVTLHIDEARTEGEAEVMAFTWAATGPSGPFARLIGTVRVVALDSSRTEVSVSGRYRAPREYSGGPLDPAALALVAEATLRSLLLRLARVMERP